MIYRCPDSSSDSLALSENCFPERLRRAVFPGRDNDQPHTVQCFTTELGHYRIHQGIYSNVLEGKRELYVFLPPEYKQNSTRRFPVIYMQDGQNIFEGISNTGSAKKWGADRIMRELVRSGKVEPAIIVGIGHDGENRASDYTPAIDTKYNCGGKVERYARFLTTEVKSLIDDLYRTKPERENSLLCGSSLGAIAALYIARKEQETFGTVIPLSGTFWWGNESIHKEFESTSHFPTTFVIDYSSAESDALKQGAEKFAELLRRSGWVDGKDLHVFCHTPESEVEEAGHNELSWGLRFARRLPLVLAA